MASSPLRGSMEVSMRLSAPRPDCITTRGCPLCSPWHGVSPPMILWSLRSALSVLVAKICVRRDILGWVFRVGFNVLYCQWNRVLVEQQNLNFRFNCGEEIMVFVDLFKKIAVDFAWVNIGARHFIFIEFRKDPTREDVTWNSIGIAVSDSVEFFGTWNTYSGWKFYILI